MKKRADEPGNYETQENFLHIDNDEPLREQFIHMDSGTDQEDEADDVPIDTAKDPEN